MSWPRRRGWLTLALFCGLRPEEADKIGFDAWPKDILRHTTASMLMATWEDEGKVAATLGHSPSILHAHDRELVTKTEAKRFWEI